MDNLSAQDFYLNTNGVTCMCPAAAVGDTGVVNGITYTKRTKEQITESNASTTCTSGITNMELLFESSTNFNQDISTWDVSDVTNMEQMFRLAESFNQNISFWDVSNVFNMYFMFGEATSFNQDISTWDVSNVTFMGVMFYNAQSFNQDLSNWVFNPMADLSGTFSFSGLSNINYDILLQTFVNQGNMANNNTLGADDLIYCNIIDRDILVNTYGWDIVGDSYSTPNIISPSDIDIEPDPVSCIATNVNLGTPTTMGCGVGSITNDAPTDFPIGITEVLWTLTDTNGVVATNTQTVTVTLPVDIAEVCYVSSDDTEVTKNRIFLYNLDGENVNQYEVFRETSTSGVYETIGTIIPPENSFLDNSSDNTTQSYRYMVNTLDVCGATSENSPFHETILLQVSIAANNSVNLSWSPYVGTDYSTYNIFRQTNGGDFELLVSLSSTNTIYNDADVDVTTDSYEYYVSIDIDSCIGPGGAPLMSSPLKSNLGSIEPILGVNDNSDNLEKSISLYPNPSSRIVTIDLPNDVTLKSVRILNELGQLVHVYNTTTFNVEDLSTGMYFLQIETDRGAFVKRLIKQ